MHCFRSINFPLRIPRFANLGVCCVSEAEGSLRQNSNFPRRIKADSTVHSPPQKYFALPVGQIICRSSPRPVPDERGASRSSRFAGAGCDGRFGGALTNGAGAAAKSCGPDIPTLISGATRERCHPRRQQSPVSGASSKETVKTIAQGRPDQSGEPVVDLFACFPFLHAELRVHWAPGFPCALIQRAVVQDSGEFVSRECSRVLTNTVVPAYAGTTTKLRRAQRQTPAKPSRRRVAGKTMKWMGGSLLCTARPLYVARAANLRPHFGRRGINHCRLRGTFLGHERCRLFVASGCYRKC